MLWILSCFRYSILQSLISLCFEKCFININASKEVCLSQNLELCGSSTMPGMSFQILWQLPTSASSPRNSTVFVFCLCFLLHCFFVAAVVVIFLIPCSCNSALVSSPHLSPFQASLLSLFYFSTFQASLQVFTGQELDSCIAQSSSLGLLLSIWQIWQSVFHIFALSSPVMECGISLEIWRDRVFITSNTSNMMAPVCSWLSCKEMYGRD